MRNVQVGQNPCQDYSTRKQAELQCRVQLAARKAFSSFFPFAKSQTSSPTLGGTSSPSTATLGPPIQTRGDALVVPSPEATASAPSPTSTTHAHDTPPQTQKTSLIASPTSASTATPAASISTPNALVTPGAHIKRNNQAPLILAITSTAVVVVLIFLGLWFFIWRRRKSKRREEEEDWKWLDGWRRRHKSLSIISGGEDDSRPEKTHADNDGGQELLRRPSLRPKESTPQRFDSIASKARRKFRTISMGDVTNNTGTTSNTNFIVAAPPPHCDDTHDSNRSNFKDLTFGYYDPTPPTPIQHEPSSDDFLTVAGIRAVEKLLSTDIGVHT